MFLIRCVFWRFISKNKAILSKAGINIRGRSSKLRINYRTTEEIRKYATLVLDVNGNNNKPNKDKVDVFTLELDEYGQFTNLLDYLNKDDQKQS